MWGMLNFFIAEIKKWDHTVSTELMIIAWSNSIWHWTGNINAKEEVGSLIWSFIPANKHIWI